MDEFGYGGSDPDVVYLWDLEVNVKTTDIDVYLACQDRSSILQGISLIASYVGSANDT